MAVPTIASYLTFQNGLKSGSFFAPGSLPKLSGTVKSEGTAAGSLPVYARLFSPDGRLTWHRPMSYTGTVGGSPVYEYQTLYPGTGTNHSMYITFGSSITGGSWAIAFYGISTAPIPWGASEATIRAAIQGHPYIGSDVTVTLAYNGSLRRQTITLSGRFARTKWEPEANGIPVWRAINNLTGSDKGMTMTRPVEGSGDFPSTSGEYQIDMVALDPVSYRFSGNAGTIRDALGPSPLTFYIDEAPTIGSMVPAAAAVLTVSNPTFSWTQTNLGNVPVTDIRAYIYETGVTEPVYTFRQTGANLNSLTSFTVPPRTLKNGGSYTWFLDVFKKSGAVTKNSRAFTVAFTRPTAHAAAFSVSTDGGYIDVSWTASALSDADFNSYVIKAREVGQAEDGPLNKEVWSTTFKARNVQRIFKFPRNVPMILSFYVRKNVSGDTVDYQPTSLTTTVNIDSVIIANPGSQEYALLKYHEGRDIGWLGKPTPIPVWSGTKPVANMPTQTSRDVQFTARIFGTLAERRSQWAKIQSLYLNATASALMYADAFGEVFDIILDPPTLSIAPGGWNVSDVGISGFEVDAIIESTT